MKIRYFAGLFTLVAVAACSKAEGDGGQQSGSGASSDDGDSRFQGDGDGGSSSDQAGTGGTSISDERTVLDFGMGGGPAAWVVEPPDDLDFSYDPAQDSERDECVALNLAPEVVHLDIFLVLDRSGSMDSPFAEDSGLGDCNLADVNNGSRWCNAINAIDGFASDPSSVEMGIAYSDFAFSPCDGFDMLVPQGLIEADDGNGHLANLRAALDSAEPRSGTNTEGAVNTLITQTANHDPLGNRRTIGILVTDGTPYLQPEPHQFAWQKQACEVESIGVSAHLTALNAQLRQHYIDTEIPTFVIGMDGVDSANLELLAAGAGAALHTDNCLAGPACSYYSVGNGNPLVFISALEEIRRSVVGCEYVLTTEQLGSVDLSSLSVKYSSDTGEPLVDLDSGDNLAACELGGDYYIDNSGADPVVHLCPSLCSARGDGASVDIAVTCDGT